MAKEYIEREAAIELLSQPITMSMCLSTEECHRRIAQQRIDRYLIENIPAADVRPVVRGKWKRVVAFTGIEAFGFKETMVVGWGCNVCGYEVDASEESFNYCPNCGADMREES